MAKIESIYLEGKNEQAVLLCHTLAGEPGQMKELARKLHKKGYTVSVPLYPGHGMTLMEVIHTEVPDWYETVITEYDRLKTLYEKVYICGMSIGGTFAAKVAEERDPAGLVTINAPIIGFELLNDLFQFRKQSDDKEVLYRYRDHRMKYFEFVVEMGQIEKLNKITCPVFVMQGSQDLNRYKTSSMMLMHYVNSENKQRKDYPSSAHLVLLDNDKKQALKDIIEFIESN